MNIGQNLPPRDKRDAKLWNLLPAIDAPYDNHRLSSAETEALVEALGDGFGERAVQGYEPRPIPWDGSSGLLEHAFYCRPNSGRDPSEGEFWYNDDAPAPAENFPLDFNERRLRVYFQNQFNRCCQHKLRFLEGIFKSDNQLTLDLVVNFARQNLYEKPWYEFHALQFLDFIDMPDCPRCSALHFSGQLGRLVEQYYWRFRFEKAAITGVGAQQGASAGGKAKAERHQTEHSEWQNAASKIWANRPDLGKRAVANIIRKQLGLVCTAKHIMRYIAQP
jgi:hypothetical protein